MGRSDRLTQRKKSRESGVSERNGIRERSRCKKGGRKTTIHLHRRREKKYETVGKEGNAGR